MSAELDVLVRFVNAELLDGRSTRVDADTPLFEDGLIDSLNILRLIAFIETRAGHDIPDRDVVMNRFRTVRTIVESFLS
jgi:acyl carrier protein